MSNKLALAPGFYYIRSRESTPRDLVNPGTDNQQLYVATSTTDLSHQVIWLFCTGSVIYIFWHPSFCAVADYRTWCHQIDGRWWHRQVRLRQPEFKFSSSGCYPEQHERRVDHRRLSVRSMRFTIYFKGCELLVDIDLLGPLSAMNTRARSSPTIPASVASP